MILPTSTSRRCLNAYGASGFATVRLRHHCRHRRRPCCCRRPRRCCCFVRRRRCFPRELVGVSSCRRVVAGRGADLFGGVGSFPGEGVIFAALQLLLEQELEVLLSLSRGFVLLGGGPEVELLCVLVQRSQRLIGCCRVPLGGRLSALWDRVDGGGREGGRRRRGR